MNKNIAEVRKRAIQYWFVDGLAELVAGLVGLFLAILFWIWQDIFLWRWSLPVILVAGLVVSFGMRLIIQRIKERSTYLWTGYAAPFSGLKGKWSVAIAVSFTLLLLGANYYLTTRGPQRLLWSPGLAGLTFAFAFAWIAALTKHRRFYIPALLSLFGGVVMALLGMDYFRGVGVLAGVAGLILLYQGYRVRRAYINHATPLGNLTDE